MILFIKNLKLKKTLFNLCLFLVCFSLCAADIENAEQKNQLAVDGQVIVRLKKGNTLTTLKERWNRELEDSEEPKTAAPRAAKDALEAKVVHYRKPLRIKKLTENLKTPDTSQSLARKHKQSNSRKITRTESLPETLLLEYESGTDVKILLKELENDPDIEICEPNYIFRLEHTPNDAQYPMQWGHSYINLPAAWDYTVGTRGSGQVVAVLDTGCDISHEDLSDNIWGNPGEIAGNGIDDDGNGYVDDMHGWSIINNSATQLDDLVGHGTHVAGVIAAVADNATGIAGVAPNAEIMVVKVFQADGSANLSNLIEAIDYAYFSGATVINMSFGGPQSQLMEDALARAYSQAVLVASAGNDWKGAPIPPAASFPASLDYVVAVGACDQSGKSAIFSNRGDVYAPGVGIVSTLPNDSYASWSGTSMAAPYVSGLAALYQAYFPSKGNDITSAQLIQGNSHVATNPITVSPIPVLGPRVDAIDIITTPTMPYVNMLSYEVTDPAPGGNGDGIPDVGETVLVNVTLKNFWDTAFNAQATLIALDTTNSSVSQGTCNYSNIGAFATKDSTAAGATLFEVEIDSNAAHGLVLPFDLAINYDGLATAKTAKIYIEANRATTFSGHINENLTWTKERLWRLTGTTILEEGYTLTIEPGAKVIIDEDSTLNVDGRIIAIGTKDSNIEISGDIAFASTGNHIEYAKYTGQLLVSGQTSLIVRNSKLYDIGYSRATTDLDFTNNLVYGGQTLIPGTGTQTIHANLIMGLDNPGNNGGAIGLQRLAVTQISENIFIDNVSHVSAHNAQSYSVFDLSNNYFFEESVLSLAEHVYDRFDATNAGLIILPETIPQPISDIPSTAPPVVAEILFDQAEPVGAGELEVTVVFNKSMDMSTSPFVAYGAVEPFTQWRVSGDWLDNKTWVGTTIIGRYVSDGINQIYVSDTRDEAHYMPLIGYAWEEFEISTASLQSLGLQANPGPSVIELSWLALTDPRSIGVNIYRSSTSGGPYQKVNSSIVTESSYTDVNVNQGTNYYYITRDVTASLEESPESSEVSSMPGDAISPVVSHTPPTPPNLGSEPYVVATITDNIEVAGAFLHYRVGQSGNFLLLAMENTTGSLWRAQLPPATDAGYSYYIEASDGINSTFWQSEQTSHALAVSGAPVSEFSATPLSGNTPLLIQFTDQSTGGATSWQWDFDNNGSVDATQRHPSYIYNQPGTYTVRQIVSNSSGSHAEVKTDFIIVSVKLNSAFTADKRAGAIPLTVQFNDQSSGSPEQWAWDFDGDGNIDSTVQHPSYTYNSAGLYTVSLTVTSPNSNDSKTMTGYVAAYSDATTPQPNFVSGASTGTPGGSITFSDLSAGGGTSWEWDFDGDGNTDSFERNPTHAYTEPGKYDVTLRVTNNNGTTELTKQGFVLIYDTSIAYQGRLRMNGQKANASFSMQFRLFENATSGSEIWSETHTTVALVNGLFSVYLGDTTPISQQILDDSAALYLEVRVYDDSTEQWHILSPRFRLSNTIRSRQIVE